MIDEYIHSVADIVKHPSVHVEGGDYEIYVSKLDRSYLTQVGMELSLKWMLRKGITEQLQSTYKITGEDKMFSTSVGFNPVEQKWYGWSHRAVFGFGVGATCKAGNCGFMPKTKEEFRINCLNFWGDLDMEDSHKKNVCAVEVSKDGKLGVYVKFEYDDKVPNESLRDTISGHFSPYPDEWGKGEWTATTLDEAKEMAIDFARSVS